VRGGGEEAQGGKGKEGGGPRAGYKKDAIKMHSDPPHYGSGVHGKGGKGGKDRGGGRLPLGAWSRVGIPPPEGSSVEAQAKREYRLKTLCAAANFDEDDAAVMMGGGGGDIQKMQVRAKHRQFVSEALLDPVFVPALGELVARGDVRTVCLAADLLSRLYALCLSCGPQVPGKTSMIEHLIRNIASHNILNTCAHVLLQDAVVNRDKVGGERGGEEGGVTTEVFFGAPGGGRLGREGEGMEEEERVVPTARMSLLCFMQTVVVFFPQAVDPAIARAAQKVFSASSSSKSSSKSSSSSAPPPAPPAADMHIRRETARLMVEAGMKMMMWDVATYKRALRSEAAKAAADLIAPGRTLEEAEHAAPRNVAGMRDISLHMLAQMSCLRLVPGPGGGGGCISDCFAEAIMRQSLLLVSLAQRAFRCVSMYVHT
jgi:hypothetical protein